MRILSWNIQSTKGCDDVFDSERIIRDIKAFGELDAICLQEVARYIEPYSNNDQKKIFEEAFANYHSAWAPGFSRPLDAQRRQEFGNLTLVKHGTLLDQRSHQLPMPCVRPAIQIPRTLVETVIRYHDSSITLLSTHLAYHSALESQQQLDYLANLKAQILGHASPLLTPNPEIFDQDAYHSAEKGHHVLLCGDLNVALDSPSYLQLTQTDGWLDCATLSTNKTRQPTCGVHDQALWPEGPHTRDYFLCSATLQNLIDTFEVNTETMASDHQPICLTLKD
ncbi:endonuclease/exonuclease/phosphatase family protein [Oceanospirillum sp.]|uniref:endonuclease/exonuclease/phosphatase family protein n=1 Tax=Oceanospirillum sp. TaxID=2021254 RepID=UPI003A8F39DA